MPNINSSIRSSYSTFAASFLHLRDTCTQWAKSLRPHSMHVSSTADCSQVSYVSSRACGQTRAKTRSSSGAGSLAMQATDVVGGGGYAAGSNREG